jgi:flagellar assembly protein FliH
LSSRIIRREQLGAVRKVDLGNVAAGASAAGVGRDTGEAAARAEIERVREQAYRDGVAAGHKEARALVEQQRADLEALIAGVNELMQNFEQTLANDVLSIGLELTKLIVRQSLRINPEIVLPVVREAIANLPGIAEQTVIALHPADAELFRKLSEGEPALAALPWKVVEDAQIERGGCRLETPSTEIDATLETRWRRVIASLGRDDPWVEITV